MMKKYFVVLISLLLLLLLPVFGADSQSEDDVEGEGIGTLHMSSNVPKNAGVNVPAGATLVGNLLIEYSYDGNEWEYVSDADVEIDNLGQVSDAIYLQASYYGNEPVEYNCDVSFSTGGWNRKDGRSLLSQSRSIGDSLAIDNSNSALPISFQNLVVSFDAAEARTGEAERITVIPGDTDSSFSIMVPVQNPINGKLVASLQAAWPQRELPSGDYAADIQIAVTAN